MTYLTSALRHYIIWKLSSESTHLSRCGYVLCAQQKVLLFPLLAKMLSKSRLGIHNNVAIGIASPKLRQNAVLALYLQFCGYKQAGMHTHKSIDHLRSFIPINTHKALIIWDHLFQSTHTKYRPFEIIYSKLSNVHTTVNLTCTLL